MYICYTYTHKIYIYIYCNRTSVHSLSLYTCIKIYIYTYIPCVCVYVCVCVCVCVCVFTCAHTYTRVCVCEIRRCPYKHEWITYTISYTLTLRHPLLLFYSDTPDVITRMDHIIEIQNMHLLVNVKTCQEHFAFIQIMKELFDRDGFDPRVLLLNLIDVLVHKYRY